MTLRPHHKQGSGRPGDDDDDGFGLILLIAAMGFVALLLWAVAVVPAQGQSANCMPTEAGLQHLQESHQERPKHRAALGPGQELLVTVSPTGSWSILVIGDGLACMVAAGQSWQDAERPL